MNPSMAQGIAALGRGGDTMLVHMSPKEVRALQSLAMAKGGSLTINPRTGLPEAGILSSLLPTIAGFALNAAFPGSGLLIGAGIGGLTALTSGSLKKGLMAGLGAYGGAGLQGAFAGMAPTTAEAGIQTLTESAVPQGLSATATPSMAFNPINGNVANYVPFEATAGEMGQFANGLSSSEAAMNMGGFGSAGSSYLVTPPAPQGGAWAGAKEVFSSGPKAWQFAKDNYKDIGAAAAPLLDYAMGADERAARDRMRGLSADGSGAASYTDVDFNPGDRNPRFGEPGQPYFLSREFGPAQRTNVFPYAAGGIASLATGGRYLKGPGDGTSDSIPAVINGPKPQPAALADGEFVVDARTVAELGNGSSDAGARKLYGMMDRVAKARAKAKRGQNTNAERFLPA